jgi:hypothetical protein
VTYDLSAAFPTLSDPTTLRKLSEGPSAMHASLARESEAMTMLFEVLHQYAPFKERSSGQSRVIELDLLWHANETPYEKLRRSHEIAEILRSAFVRMRFHDIGVRGPKIDESPRVSIMILP